MSKFDDKVKDLKKELEYCVDTITQHQVTLGWYNAYVDMDYDRWATMKDKQTKMLDIIEVHYNDDMYCSPKHMLYQDFMNKPISVLVDELAV